MFTKYHKKIRNQKTQDQYLLVPIIFIITIKQRFALHKYCYEPKTIKTILRSIHLVNNKPLINTAQIKSSYKCMKLSQKYTQKELIRRIYKLLVINFLAVITVHRYQMFVELDHASTLLKRQTVPFRSFNVIFQLKIREMFFIHAPGYMFLPSNRSNTGQLNFPFAQTEGKPPTRQPSAILFPIWFQPIDQQSH